MSEPFRPIGGISRRQMIVDHFATLGYGETTSYETLELLLNADRSIVQAAMHQAKRELEKDYQKVVVPEPGKGYKIVEPKEQFDVAVKREKQARRKRRSAHSALTNVDENRLSDAEKAKFDAGRSSTEAVMVFEKKHDIRIAGRRAVDDFLGGSRAG